LLLTLSAVGAVLSLGFSASLRCGQGERIGALVTSILASWLPVIMLAWNYLPRLCHSNESTAIAACKTYAEAQDIFRRTDWDKDGILEYAQSLPELEGNRWG